MDTSLPIKNLPPQKELSISIKEDGSFIPPLSEEYQKDPFLLTLHIPICSMSSKYAIDNFKDQVISIGLTFISSIYLHGDYSASPNILYMMESVLSQEPFLTSLRDFAVTNINFSVSELSYLYKLVSKKGLRACWQKLSLIRCSLSDHQIAGLFDALRDNTLIEHIGITGGFVGKQALTAIVDTLTKFTNSLRSLSLVSCSLDREGLESLNRILSFRTRPPLVELLVSNNSNLLTSKHITASQIIVNSKVTDNEDHSNSSLLDGTFKELMQLGRVVRLNLSGCGIHACDWARYLPFLRTLQYLNISQNLIDDDNLVRVSVGLEKCWSLIELDISNNRFRRHGGHALANAIKCNGGLQSLSSRCNRFVELEVWKSLANGLSRNKCLLMVDFSDCGVNNIFMEALKDVFLSNSLVDIVLGDNPIPPDAARNFRKYCKSKSKDALDFSVTRMTDSLLNGKQWRSDTLEAIKDSLEAGGLVDKSTGEVTPGFATIPQDEFDELLWSQRIVEQSAYWIFPNKLAGIVQDVTDLYAPVIDEGAILRAQAKAAQVIWS